MPNTERNNVIPAVHLVVTKEDQVLLLRRFNTDFQDGMYTLISGHIETGERPEDAACREAKEETGITVNPGDLKPEQVIYRRGMFAKGNEYDSKQPERVDIFFSTMKWKGQPQNMEPDDCDDVDWFPLNNLPKNIFAVTKTFLEKYPNQPRYKSLGY